MRMFSTWKAVASRGREEMTMSRSSLRIRCTHSMVASASLAGSTVKSWSYLFLKYRASFARSPASGSATGEDSRPAVETTSKSTVSGMLRSPGVGVEVRVRADQRRGALGVDEPGTVASRHLVKAGTANVPDRRPRALDREIRVVGPQDEHRRRCDRGELRGREHALRSWPAKTVDRMHQR